MEARLCGGGERGSVSVEFALALPSVVLVLGFILAGATWVRADIGATQAAATAARIALTDGDEAGVAAGVRVSNGVVSVTREAGWIVARVTVPGTGPVPDARAIARVPARP